MAIEANRLIWIDLEMTGLDTVNDSIIEIATIVTDANLEVVDEGPVLAIHQPADVLAGMDEWNTRQHTESGLVDRVKASRMSVADAERQSGQRTHKGRPIRERCHSHRTAGRRRR